MLEQRSVDWQSPDTPTSATTARKTPAEIAHAVYQQLDAALAASAEEVFEDGMESELSRRLDSLVKEYDGIAVEAIAKKIINEKVNAELAAQTLRCLGRIDHKPSYAYRRWVLEKCLECSSTMQVEGAALGLASMDDAHAIPYLRKAIEREDLPELIEDLEQVLSQLEETERCLLS